MRKSNSKAEKTKKSLPVELKTKIFLSVVFLVSLLPMLANQYAGVQGVSYLSGLTNIAHVFGVICILLVVIGLWAPLPNRLFGHALSLAGLIGIVICEIYTFLNIPFLGTGRAFQLAQCFKAAQPEFYLGLLTSVLAIFIYVCLMISARAKKRA